MSGVLLLSERHSGDSNRLRRAARSMGWKVFRPGSRLPPCVPGETAIHGEVPAATAWARALGCRLLWPEATWLADLPMRYRHRDVSCSPLHQARAHPHPAFFKSALHRRFPAALYPDGAALPDAPPQTPVLIAEPVNWFGEVRGVVHRRRLVSLSPYRNQPDLPAARRFLSALLADPAVPLPEAVVVDVGLIPGRGWAVVEANPVWASALYDGDPDAILPALCDALLWPA